MNWSNFFRNMLSGAAAGFIAGESTPGTTIQQSGILAGVGILQGILQSVLSHPLTPPIAAPLVVAVLPIHKITT